MARSWRADEEPQISFQDLLYDDEEPESEVDISDIENDDENDIEVESPAFIASLCPESFQRSDQEPLSPPYSSQCQRRENTDFLMDENDQSPAQRDRSRSPIRRQEFFDSWPLEVVVKIYDENVMPLDTGEDEGNGEDGENVYFEDPDSHALYMPPEGSMNVESLGRISERGRSGRRGGRRGVRGIRGRGGRERGRRVHTGVKPAVGHPITEVWLTDDDVPPELACLITNIVRSRKTKLQGERNQPDRSDGSESEDEEEFVDANDDLNSVFNWQPMASFEGKEEKFTQKRTGSVRVHNSAYDAFRAYWDDTILSLIVAETNRNASKITTGSFHAEWVPTNADEILCLFAFWMMLSIIKMPTYISCFSLDPLLKTEIFRRIFTRRRYENLARALSFIESETNLDGNTSPGDRLHKLRPILTHLNVKFQSEYILGKEIYLDESLTLWKGRLDFKQYIKTKAAKFGIKTYELCESVTGYLWSFIVYSGKEAADDTPSGTLKSTSIVKKIMSPLLNKGYKLFMDNLYNSPMLARYLKSKGTDFVGTLRTSRRDVPALITKVPLKRGEMVGRHSGDVSILAWQDKKRITMISTCHGAATALPKGTNRNPVRPVPFKPQVVLDYNKFMRRVDLKDQMLEPYLLERKRCNKWYIKIFKRLLNVSILNARTLLQSSTQKHHDHLAFRLSLVDSILTKHLNRCPLSRRNAAANSRSAHELPVAAGAHWPALHEPTIKEEKKEPRNNVRKRCVVCLRAGRPNSKSIFCCEVCKVPLCIPQCFKSFHETLKS